MRKVAEQTGALFIDLHNLTADYLDKEGQEKAAAYYNHDHTHTSKKGAGTKRQDAGQRAQRGQLSIGKIYQAYNILIYLADFFRKY